MKKYFIWILTGLLMTGCMQKTKNDNNMQTDSANTDSDSTKLELQIETATLIEPDSYDMDSLIKFLADRADTSQHHFSYKLTKSNNDWIMIFAGYSEYSDDEFEFENPAYLKVFDNNKLIFEDTYKGYEDIRFQDFEGYLFNGSVRLFTIKFGLEACDYANPERLYFLTDNKVGFIDEFYSQSTDYASKYIEYTFPTDSGGVKNNIIVIDKIHYPTGEEPDKADTTYYIFDKEGFGKAKAANNV